MNIRSVRQIYLKKNLFFDCRCKLCLTDESEGYEMLRHGKVCKDCGKCVDGTI